MKVFDSTPLFLVHGDSDEPVPLEHNSGVVRDRYAALGGRVELVVVPGRGHEVVPELFENAGLLSFLSV